MAKKKPTPQQRQLASLVKNYQASLSALEPEYEKIYSERQGIVKSYQDQLADYQTKLDQYNVALAEYKKDPTIEKRGSKTSYVYVSDPMSPFFGGYMPLTENYTYYETKPAPKFTEKEPAAPDLSATDTKLQEIETKKKATQQTLERETTERRSARLRAVTQGSRERPMLSKGVTLNG